MSEPPTDTQVEPRRPQPLDYATPRADAAVPGALSGRTLLACVLAFVGPLLTSVTAPYLAGLAVFAVVGLAASAAGVVVARHTWRREPHSRRQLVVGCILCGGIAVVVGHAASVSLIRTTPRSRAQARVVYCQSNLRQIYLAAFAYAQQNDERYPDGPADILPTLGPAAPLVFACKDAQDTPAPGPTTQAIRQQLAAGGHLSYLYLAKGLTTKASADTVLALDASPCHMDGTTVSILFADGHIEPRPRAQWMAILTQLASGTRPIRDPALPPATQPTTAPVP